MRRPTAEMLADPTLGACKAMREGCGELGPWKPFYQGYICRECLSKDRVDVTNHKRPEWWPAPSG